MKLSTAVGHAWVLLSLLVLAPGAAAQGADAQDPPDRFDCSLMRGLQCRAESRAVLLALYGLPTAESRLAAGSEMYRLFVFDAWMKHHIAITVERSPDSSPTLTLHAPPRPDRQGSGLQAIPPLSMPISIDNWYDVRRRGRLFDRVMVPEPEAPGVIRICMDHGPIYFVESTDPGASENQQLRRSGLGYCSEGLAQSFGIEIALLAAQVLPACAALDDRAFSSTAERLRACAILSGDRLTAAEVYNLMRPLLAEERERSSADQLAALFGDAEIVGSGVGEGVSRAQTWLQALAGEGRAKLVVERVHAHNADHAVVDGLLRRRHPLETEQDYPRDRVEEASVQLVWMRGLISELQIKRLTIGAYGPAPDRCNPPDWTPRAVDC